MIVFRHIKHFIPVFIIWQSLANDCPNKMKEEQSSHVKITLSTQDRHNCYTETFVGETLNCAILDSGCTKNVCGKAWLDSYLNNLTEKYAQKVVKETCF